MARIKGARSAVSTGKPFEGQDGNGSGPKSVSGRAHGVGQSDPPGGADYLAENQSPARLGTTDQRPVRSLTSPCRLYQAFGATAHATTRPASGRHLVAIVALPEFDYRLNCGTR
jgi:hypothetical protein